MEDFEYNTLTLFQLRFLHAPVYRNYVLTCGMTNLRTVQAVGSRELTLREEESLSDYCIYVFTKDELPRGLNFPLHFQGHRVFTYNSETWKQWIRQR